MNSQLEQRRRQRRLRQITVISVVILVCLGLWAPRGVLSLRSLFGLDSPEDTLTIYALSTLNFIALVTLVLILSRYLLKLARERREQLLGSKFKTRMVVASIALTALPTAMLFLFSFWLIDTTIEIFLQPAERVVTSARSILNDYVEYEVRDLHATARRIARTNNLKRGQTFDPDAVAEELGREARSLDLAKIVLTEGGKPVLQIDGADSGLEPIFRNELVRAIDAVAQGDNFQARARNTDDNGAVFIVVGVPIGYKSAAPRGLVVVRRFPKDLIAQFDKLEKQQAISERLVREQGRIRKRYVATLSLVTLSVMFAAVWLALYVSRSVTEPIQALVQATDEVARGNLDHRIDCVAEGELATLVRSFDRMAAQLGESRSRLMQAALELESSNKSAEERRAYIETVLASVSTGVISIDASGRLTTVNAAASRMLALGPGPYETEELGAKIGPARSRIESLLRRARRSGFASDEMEFRRADGVEIPAAISISALTDPDGRYGGAVITMEDLTELIKAERAAAWSEVARRMAHEIKNPLTPIQLSAERIKRNATRDDARVSGRFARIVDDCTATIVREVGALQHLVDEFSRFARMPQPRFAHGSLNSVVLETAALYEDRLKDVRLDVDLASDVPGLLLDSEQIRRVLVNLVDNAIEAVGESPEKQIRIATSYDARAETVRLVLSDTGHGIDPAVREQLFLPYFSTRKRGTGLGLAIVSHIVADHRGRIWAEPNEPAGARFIMEFPAGTDPGQASRKSERHEEGELQAASNELKA